MSEAKNWKRKSVKKLSARKHGVFVPKNVSGNVVADKTNSALPFALPEESWRAWEDGICPKCGNDDLLSITSGLCCEVCGWECILPVTLF